MTKKFCVIGLGNPDEYKLTRHNYGKDFILWLSQNQSLSFTVEKKSKYFYLIINDKINVLFFVVDSFMNLTGNCIEKATDFIDKIEELIIVHDDLGVPFGRSKLRIDSNRGIRGHNGIRSIVEKIYTLKKFYSDKKNKALPYFLSLGIGRPEYNLGISISDYVIQKFNKYEMENLDQVYEHVYLTLSSFFKKKSDE
jgi:aminoacyl-tRNA hydrolase